MDPRVELLIDELSTHPQGQELNFGYWRERFQSLFRERLDDDSRQALLVAYAALLNLVERSLLLQDRDPSEFRAVRQADWNILCMQEALHRSGTDIFLPADLNEIVQREIAAGRMEEGSFNQLASDGASVLDDGAKKGEPTKSFFRRIFG